MARAKRTTTKTEPELYRCIEPYIIELDGADFLVRRGDIVEATDAAFRSTFCVPVASTTRDERRHRTEHGLRTA
jgi:hypothetical protein